MSDILISSAKESGALIPKSSSKKKKRVLPWNSVMKPLVNNIKYLLWQWKNDGKDQHSTLIPQIKAAKKTLRSAQRQGAAIQRKEQQKEIMKAHEGDKNTFYKLVKRQRDPTRKSLATINFGTDITQEEGWACYFEELASPSDNPLYNEDYRISRELIFNLLQAHEGHSAQEIPTTSEPQTRKHISNLKTKKSADIFGLTTEHLQLASSKVATVLTEITNKVLETQKIPNQFRIGKVVPALKKKKPADDPNSHRRITINSIIGKVTEKEIVSRSKEIMKTQQHYLQFGFTENCSPSHCALIISEAVAEAQDTGKQLFMTLMDARKAFDVVWRQSALASMHEQGITGPIWKLYTNMYESVSSRINVNGI